MQKIRPDMDIGKNIQAIRYQNKLTQDQVIAKLNLMGISMSKSTYAKLETNRMNIKVSEIFFFYYMLSSEIYTAAEIGRFLLYFLFQDSEILIIQNYCHDDIERK